MKVLLTSKKFLVLLLAVSMLMLLAACNDGTNPNETDDPQKADNPDPAINEQILEDKEELATTLGIDINMPEEYAPSRYIIVDETQAQIDFTVGESMAYARMMIGENRNMSNYDSKFDRDEEVEVAGLTARVRYSDPEAEVTMLSSRIGIIDAYDAENNVSYMVIIFTTPTKDQLVTAMADLIASSSIVEIPVEDSADDADEADTAA